MECDVEMYAMEEMVGMHGVEARVRRRRWRDGEKLRQPAGVSACNSEN
jgi:hypothetical protein